MLDTIRQIGVFMIAAQAIVHFAPGRQYEKYIKSVSGIVILLLFLKPVLRFTGTVWEEPQILRENWEDLTDIPDFTEIPQIDDVSEEVIGRMETEMREQLNKELETDAYFVSRVSIFLIQEPGAEEGTLMPQVEILMRRRAEEEEGEQIGIGEIVVGQSQKSVLDESLLSYRARFAAVLGMEEDNVEVRRDERG